MPFCVTLNSKVLRKNKYFELEVDSTLYEFKKYSLLGLNLNKKFQFIVYGGNGKKNERLKTI